MPLSTPKPAAPKFPSTISRLRALGENKPRLRFGYSLPRQPADGLRLVLPFRRNWLLIGIVAVFLAIFAVPLFSVLGQIGPQDDDLFSLVFALFHLFWGLGWSVGVGLIALLFLALLLGREVLVVRPESMLIRLEVLGFGVGGEYSAMGISNLRIAPPDAASGTSWRGAHLAFDYYGISVGFGSQLGEARGAEILRLIGEVVMLPAGGVVPAAVVNSSPAGDIEGEEPPDGTEPARALVPPTVRPGMVATPSGATGLSAPSSLALLLANLVPLAGVWLLGWEVGEIMLLYWAESGIIGFFNLLKMAVVGRWATLFLGPFFVGHYGAFMVVHLLFVYTFFVQGLQNKGGDLVLAEVAGHFIALWPALLALTVSHAISFRLNFLGRREFVGTSVQKQMGEPYGRIMIMHLTIIFGGFVVMGLGSSLPALLLLIGAKIGTDLRAHARQRQ